MADKRKESPPRRQFASDNWSGICPEALEALLAANPGHIQSYGEDAWTQRASDLIRELFETDCEVFFVFNGTAANSLALASLCQSYHSIICCRYSHIETDECGAPEFFSNGTKILLAPSHNGKLTPADVAQVVKSRNDIHFPKPRVLSLTQATELGTVYSVRELQALGEAARRNKLRVHMDGARFANALASLDASPKALTWKVGVDVLCLGGSKTGLMIGEAVVFFNRQLAYEFEYRCKQAGQLASKMRFMAAPWVGMLESGAWLKNAQWSNRRARQLASGVAGLPGLKVLCPPQANSVFIKMPNRVAKGLRRRGWHFYDFIGDAGARFMCSWDTTPEDVEALLKDFKALARVR